LFVTVAGAMRKHRRQLDASVETSGPHDFAVRGMVVRLSTWPRPSHPASRFRDDSAYAPLAEAGWCESIKLFLPNREAKNFSLMGWTDVEMLDTQKH